jgi:hypothetical protein
VGSDPSSREGTPLKAAPTVVCARTSLAVHLVHRPVTTREKQRCVRATASRHVVRSELDGSRHTSGARSSRTHRLAAAFLGVKAGDGCDLLQAPRRLRWQRLRAAGGAMVPVIPTGTRECEHRSRAQTSRRSRYPEVAPRRERFRVERETATSLQDALASTTEATKRSCSVSLEEPGARSKHETPGHPLRGVF